MVVEKEEGHWRICRSGHQLVVVSDPSIDVRLKAVS
jgi:hypothetical protein